MDSASDPMAHTIALPSVTGGAASAAAGPSPSTSTSWRTGRAAERGSREGFARGLLECTLEEGMVAVSRPKDTSQHWIPGGHA
jgi:hypothetical protein